MNEPDYNALLVEVRKAWRIVAAYQQRVFFLLEELQAGFPELSMSYWEPSLYARPPRGTTPPTEKWSWDGLPFYSTNNWFTPAERDMRSGLKPRDWFMVAHLCADSGFDTKPAMMSSSFAGPDPILMPKADETDSELRLYVYQIRDDQSTARSPMEVWRADDRRRADPPEIWMEVQKAGADRIVWIKPLSAVFTENGTSDLISKIRGTIAKRQMP